MESIKNLICMLTLFALSIQAVQFSKSNSFKFVLSKDLLDSTQDMKDFLEKAEPTVFNRKINEEPVANVTRGKDFMPIGTLLNAVVDNPKLTEAINGLNKMVYIENGSFQFDKPSIIYGSIAISVALIGLCITSAYAIIKKTASKNKISQIYEYV